MNRRNTFLRRARHFLFSSFTFESSMYASKHILTVLAIALFLIGTTVQGQVVPMATTTTVTTSAGSVSWGMPVTITATVTAADSSTVNTGMVVFTGTRGTVNTPLCVAQIVNSGAVFSPGSARCTFVLPGGSHVVSARFVGTTAYAASADSTTVTVTDMPYAAEVTFDTIPDPAGYSIYNNLQVHGVIAPTGTLSFFDLTTNLEIASVPIQEFNRVFATQFDHVSYTVGHYPHSLAVADFNGDGFPDVVTADSDSNTITVLLGSSDGSLAPAPGSPFTVGQYPISVATGDFNSDGVPDVVVANNQDDTVMVLLGDGSGRLNSGLTLSSPSHPSFVIVTDIDSDGIPDIVTANTDSSDLRIFLGSTGGGFVQSPISPLSVGNGPVSVAAGDLNGDGFQDLITANRGNDTVSVMMNDGSGGFSQAAGSPISAGLGTDFVAVGDANGDHLSDLAILNWGTDFWANGSYTIMLGDGTGTFANAPGSPNSVSWNPLTATFYDFDGFDNMDLVVGGDPCSVEILSGDGTGQFPFSWWFNPSTCREYSVAVTDFNHDGIMDLATMGPWENIAVVLSGKMVFGLGAWTNLPGPGVHQLVARYSGDENYPPATSAPYSLNGNQIATTLSLVADPQFVSLGQNVTLTATVSPTPYLTYVAGGTVSFFDDANVVCADAVLTSAGTATCTTNSLSAGRHNLSATYSGDVNFVGSSAVAMLDIAVPSNTTLFVSPTSLTAGDLLTLTATVSDVDSNPGTAGTVNFCDATRPSCIGLALLGSAQVVASGPNQGSATLKTRLREGSYQLRAEFSGSSLLVHSTSSIVSVSVTTSSAAPSPSSSWITYSGSAGNYTLTASASAPGATPMSGTFTFVDQSNGNYALGSPVAVTPTGWGFDAANANGVAATVWTAVGNYPKAVAGGDFNGDGWPDIVTANYDTSTVNVLLGDGTGNFVPGNGSPYASSQGNPFKILVRDVNRDGNQDLLIFSALGMAVWLGDGTGHFTEAPNSPYWAFPLLSATTLDFNGDGNLDVVISLDSVDYAFLITGNGDGTFNYDYSSSPRFSLNSPGDLNSADMNGDGLPDLIAIGRAGSVSVYLNDGNGGVNPAPGMPLPLSNAPGYDGITTVGDFNNDGIPDVAVLDRIMFSGDDGLYVFLGNSPGGLTQAPGSPFHAGALTMGVVSQDFNIDGIADLAVVSQTSQTLGVYLGDNTGRFTTAAGSPFMVRDSSNNLVSGSALIASDFNGDSVPDLAIATQYWNGVAVLLDQAHATATLSNVAVPGTTSTHSVAAVYSSDAHYSTSTSNSLSLNGSIIPTTTTLTVTPNSGVVYHDTVTLSAVLSPVSLGTYAAGGTFRFRDGGTNICTNVSFDTSGTATCVTPQLSVGTHNFQATYSGDSNFATSTKTISLTVGKATPVINWPTPAAITYGARLSGTQLNATASCGGASPCGTFAYNPPINTVLSAGSQTLSVTFTPSGAYSGNFTTATKQVTLTVNKATPSITWSPVAINYGTPLSGTQLNATSTVAGTWAYTPDAGTVLNAGPQTLSVTLTPTDTTNYNTATKTVTLTVNKATPTITWANPAAITYGTTLSATQLNATASFGGNTLPGTFAYTPAAGTILQAGSRQLSATFTPTDITNFNNATRNVTITVNKATPTIAWADPSPIIYGTALSATQLNATASFGGNPVTGTFAYTPSAGTVLQAGSRTLSVTFTPTATTNYNSATGTAQLTVNQATPVITWADPQPITYGTALSATQLNATASFGGNSVAGTFAYTPAVGTVLQAGTQTLSVTFTPTDTTNYTTATGTAHLSVNQAVPVITWTNPQPITYGTALSTTQLNATTSIPGSFEYMPALGTVLSAGTHTLSVAFTPTDTVNYANTTQTVSLTVNQATPVIAWADPQPIIYGTALGATQLNATASFGGNSVAGVFAYTPGTGTILSAGPHVLSVTFTPADATDFANATQTVSLTVSQATPAITWATPQPITYGTALSAVQLNATASVPGSFEYTPTLGTVLPVGTHTLSVTFTPADTSNYTSTAQTVSLNVTQAVPTITWNTPDPITYGTTLSDSQLNATVSVPGTFAYTPPAGTVLSAGAHILSVTFTPTDTTDYANATQTVSLNVTQAAPTITWNNPNPITYGTALSSTQLNATASVPGSFSYTPPAGTVLAAGPHTLSVTFTPNDTTDYSNAAQTVSVTVNQAPTVTALTSSLNPSLPNSSVTFTATVTGTGSSPTGTVTFFDGATTLGTGTLDASGVTTFSISTLNTGAHSITAHFSGDTNYLASTSGVLSQSVGLPTITIATANPSIILTAGQQGSLPLSVNASGTLANAVTFACSGQPVGAACTFSPASVGPTVPATTTITITTTGLRIVGESHHINLGMTIAMLIPGILILPTISRRRKRLAMMLLLVIFFVAIGFTGCGNGHSSGGITNGQVTPRGNYILTVTGSSSGASSGTMNINLTVN